MIHLLNGVRWTLVAFLVYVAALMKEEQEGHWENRLEGWLRTVYTRQENSYAKVTALAKAVANVSERFTEKLFGRRLWSLRFLGVSFFYGLASVNLTILLSPLMPPNAHHPELALPAAAGRPNFYLHFVWLVTFLVMGSVPALVQLLAHSERQQARWTWGIWLVFVARWIGPLLVVAGIIDRQWGHHSTFRFVLGIGIVVGLNFLLDVVFVAATRWALALASNTKQLPGIVLALLLDVGLGYAVIVGPLFLGVKFITTFHAGVLSMAPMIVFALKSIDFAIAFIALIIFLAIGMHAVVWFVLERPIYACLRFKVIRDKKLLRGIILALVALPQVGSVWAFFIALLRAF